MKPLLTLLAIALLTTGCFASTNSLILDPNACPPLQAGDLKRGDVPELKNKLIEVGGEYKKCAGAYRRARGELNSGRE